MKDGKRIKEWVTEARRSHTRSGLGVTISRHLWSTPSFASAGSTLVGPASFSLHRKGPSCLPTTRISVRSLAHQVLELLTRVSGSALAWPSQLARPSLILLHHCPLTLLFSSSHCTDKHILRRFEFIQKLGKGVRGLKDPPHTDTQVFARSSLF